MVNLVCITISGSVYRDYPFWYVNLHIILGNLIYTHKFRSAFRIDQSENSYVKTKLVMGEKDDEVSDVKVKRDVV